MRRRGPLSTVRAAATDAAAGLRRLLAARRVAVRTIGDDGQVRAVDTSSPEGEALLEAAEALLEAGRIPQ